MVHLHVPNPILAGTEGWFSLVVTFQSVRQGAWLNSMISRFSSSADILWLLEYSLRRRPVNETLVIMSLYVITYAELLLKSMLQSELSRTKTQALWGTEEDTESSLRVLWDVALICCSEMPYGSVSELTLWESRSFWWSQLRVPESTEGAGLLITFAFNLQFSSTTSWLCEFRQAAQSFWASVFLLIMQIF